MRARLVRGKLIKEKAMQKHRVLRRHLPETHPFNTAVLAKMMKRYRLLFIKPDKGKQGYGIVRLRKLHKRKVELSWDLRHRIVHKQSVRQTLQKILRPKGNYLIQQGLHLAKYKDRLIDIRVYMQKPNSDWLISGKVVRVGAARRFVTNYHQGGKPKTLKTVLGSIYKDQPDTVKTIIRSIDNTSTITAKVLDRNFPGIRQLGIDIAVDTDGRIWIIEANTSPAFLTFKHLKNKTMYHRILKRFRYIRSKYR